MSLTRIKLITSHKSSELEDAFCRFMDIYDELIQIHNIQFKVSDVPKTGEFMYIMFIVYTIKEDEDE